jgi:DNA primase
VSNIEKALPWITAHKSIAAFMDNDEAGRKTLEKIIENVPDEAGKVCVYDMAKLYEGYNDLNEKLSDELSSKDKHSSTNTHSNGDNII